MNGTTDNVEDLTLTAGAGSVKFDGIVGGVKKLGDISIVSAADVTAALAVTADTITQSAGTGTTWFKDTVTTAAAGGINLTGTNVKFDKAVNTGAAGVVTVVNSGALTILAAGDMTLGGAFAQSGGGTVSTAGDITTTSDPITFTNAVTLSAGPVALSNGGGANTGDIWFKSTLNGTTDNVEDLTLTAGAGSVKFDGIVGGVKKLGDISIVSAADVTAALAVTADTIAQSAGTGTTWFKDTVTTAAAGGINLTGTNVKFDKAVNTGAAGVVTVVNSGALTILAAGDMTLGGAFAQSGGGTVSTAGDITTTSDPITFTNAVTLSAGPVALSNGGGANTGDIWFKSTLNGTTDNVEDLTLTAGAGSVKFDGIVGGVKKLGDISIVSAADVTAALAVTADTITQSAGTGTTWFKDTVTTAAAGGINLTGTNVKFDKAVNTGAAGVVTVVNSGALTILAAGDMTLGGAFAQSGGGTVSTAGDITTTSDPITFTNAVTLSAGPVALSNGGGANTGDIWFKSTLNGTTDNVEDLTLTAGAGSVKFDGIVGGVKKLGDISIVSAADVTAALAVTADTIAQSAGTGTTWFKDTVTTAAAGGINLTGTNVKFDKAVNTGAAGVVTVVNSGALTILAAGDMTLGGAFAQSGGGTVSTAGDITTTSDPITFTNAVTLSAGPVALSNGGGANTGDIWFKSTLNGTTDNVEDLTLTAGAGSVKFDGIVGGVKKLGDISIVSAADVTAALAVTADTIAQSAGTGTTWFKDTVTTAAAGGINLTGTNVKFDKAVNTGAAGVVTVVNSGALTILAAGDMTLGGAFAQSGGGTVSTAGDITTTSDPITFTNAVTLSAGPVALSNGGGANTGDIWFKSTLNGTTDNVEDLTLTAGAGSVKFDGIVGGVKKLGDISIVSAADVTAALAVTADTITQSAGTGTTWFKDTVTTAAAGGINLTGTNVKFDKAVNTGAAGVVTVVNSGALTILAAGDMTLGGAFAQSGGGTVSTAGDITTTSDPITFTNAVTLSAGPVALSNGGGANTGDIWFKSTLNGTTDNVEDLTLTAGAGSVKFDGIVGGVKKLGDISIVSAADVTAALAVTADTITQSAGTGTTWFKDTVTTAAAGGINLTGTNVKFDKAVNTGAAGVVTVVNSGALTILAAGDMTLGGAFAQSGGGTVSTAGDITTTSDPITFTNAVTLSAGPVALSNGGGANTGDIWFKSTLNGTTDNVEDLTLTAGAGSVKFDGIVGGVKKLGDISIVSAADVTAALAVTADTITQSAGTGTTWFKDTVTTAAAGGINLTGTNVKFDKAVNTGAAGVVTVVNSGALTILAAGDMTLGGAFAQSGGGTVSTAGDITTTSDPITFTNAVTLSAGPVALSNGGGANTGDIWFKSTLNGTTADTENLTITAGVGSVKFDGAVGAVRLGDLTIMSAADVTAAAITSKTITQTTGSGTTTLNGALNTDGALGIDLNGTAFTINAGVTTTNGGPISITNSGLLTIAAAGDMNLDGSFTQDGGGLVSTAGDITTSTDNIYFTTGVMLTGPVALSMGTGTGAAITFNNTLNGTTDFSQTLGLMAGGGDILFNGIVGGTTDLGIVTINSARNVTANAAFNAQAVNQTAGTGTTLFSSAVNTSGASATDGLDLNGTAFTFNGAVNTGTSGAVSITNSGLLTIGSSGDMTLGGAFLQDGTGAVSTAGDITTTVDSISFARAITLTGPIALNSAGGNIGFGSTVNSDAAGTTRDLTLTAGAGNITFTGAVGTTASLEDLLIASTNNVTATAITAETITQQTGTGTTTFNGAVTANPLAAGLAVDLNGNAFTINNTVTTTNGGQIVITNAGLLTIAAAGNMTLEGAFTQDGAGLVSTAGDITTTADNISFASPVTMTDNINISTGIGVGDITFASPVDDGTSSYTLNLNADTGSISLNDVSVGTLNFTKGNTLTLNGDISVENAFDTTPITGNIVLAGDSSITTTDDAITLNTVVDMAGHNFTLDARDPGTGGIITLNREVTGGSTTGAFTINGASDIDINGKNILGIIYGGINAKEITIQNFGTIDLGEKLNLIANNGGILITSGDHIQLSGGTDTTNEIISYTVNPPDASIDLVSIYATNNPNLHIYSEGSAILDTVNVNAGNLLIHVDTDDNDQSLLYAAYIAAFLKELKGYNLTSATDIITANNILSYDKIEFGGDVVLDTNSTYTTMNGQPILFDGKIYTDGFGNYNLGLYSSGQTYFGGDIGGTSTTTALGELKTDANGTTVIDSNVINADKISFGDPVTFNNTLALTAYLNSNISGSGNITFGSTVTGTGTGALALTADTITLNDGITTNGGSMSLTGPVTLMKSVVMNTGEVASEAITLNNNVYGQGLYDLTLLAGNISVPGSATLTGIKNLSMTATSSTASLGTSTDPIDTQNITGTLTANAANSAGGVYVNNTGNLAVASINAGTGNVELNVSGTIKDTAGSDTTTDISGAGLTIKSATGIGTSASDALNLNVNNLTVTTSTGDVFVTEANGMGLGTVNASGTHLEYQGHSRGSHKQWFCPDLENLTLAAAGGIGM